jgi:hypothetical protein
MSSSPVVPFRLDGIDAAELPRESPQWRDLSPLGVISNLEGDQEVLHFGRLCGKARCAGATGKK